ncbi:hypothetical protein LCGC14_1698110 [marine sediment metagenome]|uniref:Uncharacterized protein n=1 Tax=marine sediment metagenome TaxID=412755 RepID=A0A0F9HIL2_9ZZZZ
MTEKQEVQTGDIQKEMNRISGKGFSPAGCYEHSFGALPDKNVYFNPWGEMDLRKDLKSIYDQGFKSIQVKALGPETGGAGTAGFALVPVYVDPRIVDRSRKYTPMVELVPRVTNMGMTADFNVITAKGGAVTAGLDAALTETTDTYDRVSKSIKFIYSVGRVLGPMQAAMPSYMLEGFQSTGAGIGAVQSPFSNVAAPNARQTEVLVKARAMKEKEEDLILNGDSSSDATEFDGIVVQQSTTNQKDLSSAALTWDDIEESVQDAFDDGGRPNLGVASSAVVTDIRKILIDVFRFGPGDFGAGDSLPFGVPSAIIIKTMVGDIPILPSMYLSNTTGAKQIFFLDMDFIEMRVLQDMTFEELAKTNDSSKFMLKIYECLILRAPQFNSFIDNIG